MCARVRAYSSDSLQLQNGFFYSSSESDRHIKRVGESASFKTCSRIILHVCIASTNCSTTVLSSPTTLETPEAISFAFSLISSRLSIFYSALERAPKAYVSAMRRSNNNFRTATL